MKIIQRIKNSKWWKAAGIRAVKTFAEAAIAAIGTAAVMWEVDWKYTLSAALLAAIISILVSLAGLPEVEDEPIKVSADEYEVEDTTTESTEDNG